jgi:hypothetical protein
MTITNLFTKEYWSWRELQDEDGTYIIGWGCIRRQGHRFNDKYTRDTVIYIMIITLLSNIGFGIVAGYPENKPIFITGLGLLVLYSILMTIFLFVNDKVHSRILEKVYTDLSDEQYQLMENRS